MGPQVHPDRRGLHLFPIRADQDPQRRLEPQQLAGELDPHVGDRSPATRARPVPDALSGAAAPHAVVLVHCGIDLAGGLVAARSCVARSGAVLAQLPRFHGRRALHPLRADRDLLAGLRAARALWSLAERGYSRLAAAHRPATRPASGAGFSRSGGRRQRLADGSPASSSQIRPTRTTLLETAAMRRTPRRRRRWVRPWRSTK